MMNTLHITILICPIPVTEVGQLLCSMYICLRDVLCHSLPREKGIKPKQLAGAKRP